MIMSIINEYQSIIFLVVLAFIVILLIIEILNRIELNRIEKRYKKLMKGTTGKNIEEMLYEYKKNVENAIDIVNDIKNDYNNINLRLSNCVQKVSVIRYRAFDDVGSDLSFSIALLNEKNDGVVLTGIYGRNECTTFAKPIENGISKYDLSDEEKTALKDAMTKK
ncbi:Protein of unknown function [Caloramator quimbayensis]|uniref:DUF4446 domain-containing protein n=1 Tax=Caloramator quimbayensis TaxID=1147123 RepID=A0A1T4Y736_9CLOT|nr:DUF4446 family protein [Caloramator quimbayensis]SKA97483.1 Protein of unknown function [Caloramator quimbayensis]